ncbi:hypothetical protein AB6A40_002879 [Gnathostoma spinigerum]|uniref:Uncharacterized protein n=1 Tax=Gnathostoma spinigerum TaxID=75299 RepID=A0ABD6EIP3_9BILA
MRLCKKLLSSFSARDLQLSDGDFYRNPQFSECFRIFLVAHHVKFDTGRERFSKTALIMIDGNSHCQCENSKLLANTVLFIMSSICDKQTKVINENSARIS